MGRDSAHDVWFGPADDDLKRLTDNWMNNSTAQAFLQAAEAAGFGAYFVGGCVRNALLGLPVNDLDLATNARPEQVIALAQSLHFKPIPTGIEHGTITVVNGQETLEITTFRKDVETDGRHAVVAFANTLVDDAKRRDFRMNALYADRRGNVIDPVGGLEDIEAKRIRFVGAADARIREDYLRIIRLFRFAAQLGFGAKGIDPDAIAASRLLAGGLSHVSIERQTSEFMKLLSALDPSDVLHCMHDAGVLEQIVPDVQFEALLHFIENEEVALPLGRLAAATHAQKEVSLRLSKRDAGVVQKAKDLLLTDQCLREFAYRNGADLAELALRVASAKQGVACSSAQLAKIKLAAEQSFPVSAQDLMPKLAGKALGDMHKKLELDWINSGFQMSRTELLQRALNEK